MWWTLAIFNLYFVCLVNGELVINTWKFLSAAEKAWDVIKAGGSSLDAVSIGCTTCEDLQCDKTVGFGGSPDEDGETTLDAMIFDGTEMDMGAVAGLRKIKNAALAARHVLDNTKHSILSGELASKFAVEMGLQENSLSTNYSKDLWHKWKDSNCQPNFWKNVEPNPKKMCGPYHPAKEYGISYGNFDETNHDTIGMIAIDKEGHIVAGTSSNGANHKIPGRVGDAAVPGAGAYADSWVGGAVATGDGDVMMRFLPSFSIVEEMRRGSSPEKAAHKAIVRIASKYPQFMGALIAVNAKGEYGAACNGITTFPYCVVDNATGKIKVLYQVCL